MPLYIPEDTTEDGVHFRIHIEQDSEVDYRTVIIFLEHTTKFGYLKRTK